MSKERSAVQHGASSGNRTHVAVVPRPSNATIRYRQNALGAPSASAQGSSAPVLILTLIRVHLTLVDMSLSHPHRPRAIPSYHSFTTRKRHKALEDGGPEGTCTPIVLIKSQV